MSLLRGRAANSSETASRPPADAPIATMGEANVHYLTNLANVSVELVFEGARV